VYRFTHRRVRYAELPGHEVQHLARHVERVLQERPEPAYGHQLEREAGLHVIPASQVCQLPVLVIEEEHPLQVRLRRRPRVPAVCRRLVIRQELNRHRPHRRGEPPPFSPAATKRYKTRHP
jgi:hypothetical protein